MSRLGLLLLIAMALTGCHSIDFPARSAPTAKQREHTGVEVGVGRADITIPPGAGTFGHGPDARVANGYWTRAYCRVFYFETESGKQLAIIPCDLPAMSLLLQRKVAAKTPWLHPSQIMMTATHTHAGVGHFFGARQYTGVFSTRAPGYDESIAERLAEQVARALEYARHNKRPAKLTWIHRSDFWCFTRNRSLAAYQLNPSPRRVTPDPAHLPPCLANGDRPDLAAIDPELHVLRIDRVGDGNAGRIPIGSLSFFAMHPTVVKNTNQLFGGDTAAIVSRHVERELRREWCELYPKQEECSETSPSSLAFDPLHGVINTNEGDISPIWSRGDIQESIAVGENIGRFVWATHGMAGATSEKPLIDSRYWEENIREPANFAGSPKPCGTGSLGQGSAAGGSDHLTSVSAIPMFSTSSPVDFSKPEEKDCHSPKTPLLGLIGKAVTSGEGTYPSHLPFAVAQIDDVVISFVPAEMTITAGQEVNQKVLGKMSGCTGGDAAKVAIVAGLSNEYIQYVATRAEYQIQEYEGASTLYGPNSSAYLADRFARLAGSMCPNGEQLPRTGEAQAVTFEPDMGAERLQPPSSDPPSRKHIATCQLPTASPPRICMYWQDGGTNDVSLLDRSWVSLVHAEKDPKQKSPPRPVKLCLEQRGACDPFGVVDDRGSEFRTRIHDEVGDGWVWSTVFSPSAITWKELAKSSVRIQVGGRTGNVKSTAFSAASLPEECTVHQVRLCVDSRRTIDWSRVGVKE